MILNKEELIELSFLSNDSGIDLYKFKLYFCLFKLKTNLDIIQFVQIYMDLENQYSLFSDYVQMSGPLLEFDIRQFYNVYFVPDYDYSLNSQIKNFEESNKIKFLDKNFNEINQKNYIFCKYPELKSL